jgi:drug/metabolite transporter (DMT)-like permease
MTAIIYVTTFAAAVLLFGERPNVTRLVGLLVILAGVVLLVSDENSPASSKGPADG